MKRIAIAALLLSAPAVAAEPGLGPDDLARLADVAAPAMSPDGRTIVYSLSVTNEAEDKKQSDLWRVAWRGGQPQALTFTPVDDEWLPRWSLDGQWLAFLSDRGGEDAKAQVWVMSADGGEARRVTDLAGGVEDYAWSPDGRRLAVVAWDPERPQGTAKPKNPPPIVTDRFQFKEDGTGYLTDRRRHLYLVDVAGGQAVQLTQGTHDEQLPSWSPDGRTIAFVTKRGDDPDRHLNYDIYLIAAQGGARERQLTSFNGADLDPYWESRPEWSPDGRRIAYLQSGEDKGIYYAPWQLAVIDVETGTSVLPAPIDRNVVKPRWSPDGRSVLALIEQNRVTHLSRIDVASGKVTELTSGMRFDADFALATNGHVAVLGGDSQSPYEIAAVEPGRLRPLTAHNSWLNERRLAPVEEIRFKSGDGTEIEGFLVKPLDYVAGQRYPTILRLHGGPVYQFSHEFMVDWQAYAAAGFAVVAVNPRGSSGKGFAFSRAIYADWGNKDAEDVLAGIDHVVALGIADPERLGIGGRSYGGILTNAVIARDGRFKAAVSGAGASNMFGMYGHDQYAREYEFELGTPWGNREAYARVSQPFLNADRIVTPTLFYCAEKDFNVPCLGTEQMYQALRSRDVPTQLVIYPGENHALAVPSYLRDRMQRLLEWYRRFLDRPEGR